MATKRVRSMSGQPVYVNLLGGRSVKLPARAIVEMDEKDLACPEMQFYLGRGSCIVMEEAKEAEAKEEAVKGKKGAK
jgi:hypothetical protein